MPTAQTLDRFITRVEQGAHVQAIEEFYTAGRRQSSRPNS